MTLTILWASSVRKWSLYEKGKKFCESEKKGEKKWRPGSKRASFFFCCFFLNAYQATSFYQALGILEPNN